MSHEEIINSKTIAGAQFGSGGPVTWSEQGPQPFPWCCFLNTTWSWENYFPLRGLPNLERCHRAKAETFSSTITIVQWMAHEFLMGTWKCFEMMNSCRIIVKYKNILGELFIIKIILYMLLENKISLSYVIARTLGSKRYPIPIMLLLQLGKVMLPFILEKCSLDIS